MRNSEHYMRGYRKGVETMQNMRELSRFEKLQYLDTLSKNADFRFGYMDAVDGMSPYPPEDDPTPLERVRDWWRDLTGG